ncbi:WDR47 [Cordylochernes scorpioides]|uniref:WDR47 n=1 Tax=Cordylochernes scorpioides TaxID=51811 RepID=A0ABY6KSF0_9ARAC|nr:WDR47 [Cordylochernes scorpioides]
MCAQGGPGRTGSPYSDIPHFTRSYSPQSSSGVESGGSSGRRRRHYVRVTQVEDDQPVRAAEFHPNGQCYVVGTPVLRICSYPKLYNLREDHLYHPPTVLYKKPRHHKGPVYCSAWNATGDLLATGSNDKTIKMMRFNPEFNAIEGKEVDINIHKGTVRDLCFMEDLSNRLNLLISGGAGDSRIYITDCETVTPFQSMQGHSGQILSLYTWGGAMFVSGSQDRTVRFWDLRSRSCVNIIPTRPEKTSAPGSPATSVCVDPTGRLLAVGHDSMVMLYDIVGGRVLQHFRPHAAEVRSVRFSSKAYFLLSASHDQTLALTDLQGKSPNYLKPFQLLIFWWYTNKFSTSSNCMIIAIILKIYIQNYELL